MRWPLAVFLGTELTFLNALIRLPTVFAEHYRGII